MKILIPGDYARARQQAYPDIGEQLDAVMKMAAALRAQGVELPPETVQWIDRCQRVKSGIPKPQK